LSFEFIEPHIFFKAASSSRQWLLTHPMFSFTRMCFPETQPHIFFSVTSNIDVSVI